MNRSALYPCVVAMLVLLNAQGALGQTVSLNTVSGAAGKTTSLTVSLAAGSEAYAGVNAQLELPSGVRLVGANRGALLGSDFRVDYYQSIDSANATFVAYADGTFAGNSGELLTLRLSIDEDAPLGIFPLNFVVGAAALSNATGTASIAPALVNGSITIIESTGEGEGEGEGETEAILNVSPASRLVNASAGLTTFYVSNSGGGQLPYSATITQNPGAFASIASGANGNNGGVVIIAFLANATGTPRVATLLIEAPDAIGSPISVSFTQEAEEAEGEGEGDSNDGQHNADQDGDSKISLSELLRVIQFYNSRGLYCAVPGDGSEDGFLPGFGADQTCPPHASDYNPTDWQVSLSELLRSIQFYNSGGFHWCPQDNTEDGYCPDSI